MPKNTKIKKHTVFHYLVTFLFVFLKSLLGSAFWIVVGVGGYFVFASKRTPIDLIVGLPLMLIGGGFVVNSMLSVFNALFSPKYNEGVCPFCAPR